MEGSSNPKLIFDKKSGEISQFGTCNTDITCNSLDTDRPLKRGWNQSWRKAETLFGESEAFSKREKIL